MKGPSSRGQVDPFIVMQVMTAAAQREAQGGDVLHLEVGQPSTPAPKGVLAATRTALETDRIGYTLSFGLQELRERIRDHYRNWYKVDVPVEQIAVTTGSSGGFTLAFLAAFEHGDRVALASPGYPAYRNILRALGIEVVDLLTEAADRYQPTVERLDKAGKLDGLIIASPSNPTGTMIDLGEMKALTDWCRANDVRLISDEIYHGINFGRRSVTALETDPETLVINSFSKYFSMTGWRIGWMVVPPDLLESVQNLAQNFFIAPPTLSQFGAIAAFDCIDEAQENVARYARNRQILLNELPAAGLDDLAPADGAFYVYANVAAHTNDSVEFCRRMLDEIGIACTPGIDFDPSRGRASVRFSFAGASDDMAEACKRLKAWL